MNQPQPSPNLADVLAKVMAPGAPAPAAAAGADPLALIVTLFQAQQQQTLAAAAAAEARAAREEERRREDKAETNKMLLALAGLVLPKMLDKPAIDPLMMKLLDNSSNKESMQQFLATSSQLNQQSSQMFMQQLAGMMGTMGDMQSRMTERQIDMMEERMAKMAEREDGDDESPLMGIIKAALPALLDPGKAKIGEAVVTAVAASTPTAPAAPAAGVPAAPVAPPAPVDPVVARKVRLMQLCMALHLRGQTFAPEKAAQYKQAIVAAVARTNDVAKAIMDDDSGALMTALTPAVKQEPPLGQWVGTVEAQAFIGGIIAEVVKPGLLAIAAEMQRRQQAANQQPPAPPQAPQEVPPRTEAPVTEPPRA